MRVIKIDPVYGKVTIVSIPNVGKLKALQDIVTDGKGGLVEKALELDSKHDLLVDEEGLLRYMHTAFFTYNGIGPFAGTGVIVGTEETEEGIDWCSAKLRGMDIHNAVEFLSATEVRAMVSAAGGQ